MFMQKANKKRVNLNFILYFRDCTHYFNAISQNGSADTHEHVTFTV